MCFVAANSLLQNRYNSYEARERAQKSCPSTRAVYRHWGINDKAENVLLAQLELDIASDYIPGLLATGLTCARSAST